LACIGKTICDSIVCISLASTLDAESLPPAKAIADKHRDATFILQEWSMPPFSAMGKTV